MCNLYQDLSILMWETNCKVRNLATLQLENLHVITTKEDVMPDGV